MSLKPNLSDIELVRLEDFFEKKDKRGMHGKIFPGYMMAWYYFTLVLV